ncbi:hypothetical protein [Streptomyces scabiei]|uniref:hypothetical protein n=1 Tax=Streptomyces scabiei TaxID=1930 RepID=UPI0029A73D80|nr:hypothetical protein [Streptomyces scabiei]MDX2794002.1 hypothetical protein [Streptomyces scabiei]
MTVLDGLVEEPGEENLRAAPRRLVGAVFARGALQVSGTGSVPKGRLRRGLRRQVLNQDPQPAQRKAPAVDVEKIDAAEREVSL